MIEIEADPYDNDGEDESGDECTMSFFLRCVSFVYWWNRGYRCLGSCWSGWACLRFNVRIGGCRLSFHALCYGAV